MNAVSPAVLEAVSREVWGEPNEKRIATVRRLAAALGVSFRYLRRATQRHGAHYEPTEPAAAVEIAWPAYDEMPVGRRNG